MPALGTKNMDYLKEVLSIWSDWSKESNGFTQTNWKDDRVYKDGFATFYSGRLYNHQGSAMKTTNYSNGTNKTYNRALRYKDTFMSVFPNYRSSRDIKKTTMKHHFYYPKFNIDGEPMHVIDWTYTNKMDRIKTYTEEITKVKNMRRVLKK